ncbi:hypothetical protein [Streptomyces liangshanensis]|uniref:hypothetical protein n=1 Tax=Streptomyces liangshanensis TaxID=2717324 RepID=UPI001FBB0865|nr:hypothetical protein [Streptomyces liangshanensis]
MFGNPDPYGTRSADPYAAQPADPYAARSADPYDNRTPETYDTRTPDWAALADASAGRARRKRWLLMGGGGLATAAVVAVVASVIVSMSGGDSGPSAAETASQDLPTAAATTGEAADPVPSFPSASPLPPPDPKDFVSSAEKDTAPLSADTLFPGARLTMEGREYEKGATTRTTNCAASAQGALGSILASNSCDEVIRATYSKDGVAVTVGVAVFAKEAQALKAKAEAKDGIASLSGSGVPTFCRDGVICRKTTNSFGRYVYFTVGGFTSGKDVTKSDKNVFTTGDDVSEFTFRQIYQRGRLQASAAAVQPGA